MANPFALLGIEGEESPSVQAPSKKDSTAASTKPAAAAKSAKPAAASPQKSNVRGGTKDFYSRGGGAQSNRKVFRGDGAGQDSSAQSEGNTKHLGESTRGAGRGRGNRGRGRGSRPDRHSQTGRTDSEKQVNQGWGGDEPKRELDSEQQADWDAKIEKDDSGVATPAAAADGDSTPATPAVPQTPVEEEDNTQTYTEYLASKVNEVGQTLAEKLGLTTKARQANEGADDAQWKNAKLLNKGAEDESYYVGESKDKSRKRQAKEGKTFIEVEANFPRPGGAGRGGQRGRGGRGGRGGERGGDRSSRGGRSNGRDSKAQAGPDFSETAFPTLA